MNVRLPDSFTTPLQHILALQLISTITDEVLDELYVMLQERMKQECYQDRTVDRRAAVHNECLSLLNKLIRKGKLGGTALCEVEDIPYDRFLITVHWAAVRTWTSFQPGRPKKKTTGIKTQKWDTARDFIFTIGGPS